MNDRPPGGARPITVAQAHRPIFYLPHVVAEAIGAFRRRSLDVDVVLMPTSDQWRMLTSGSADFAIGGPMRSMKLLETGCRVVTFSAAVANSPWVLVGSKWSRITDIDDLLGREVLDDAEIATARLCLRGLLQLGGHAPERLTVLELTESVLVNRLENGRFDLALLPLEKALPLVASGKAQVLADIGTWAGPVPWSAYQTLPETLHERPQDVTDFTLAIAEALQAIREETVLDLVRLVEDQFPAVAPGALELAIRGYRSMHVWAEDPSIPPSDFDRFAEILVASGWLAHVPDRARLLT